MSDALKPCPFCGSVPQKRDVGDYFVTCPGCGIDGPAGDSDGLPHAADAWNTRADSKLAAAEARAERYRAALKYIIDDLEIRSQWKTGDQKGVVDIGHGAYMQGKAALAEGEAG